MSSLSIAMRDSTTMLRRDARHSVRRLSMTLSGLGTPTIMLVLFNYFFGGTLGAGLGGVGHDGAYINYAAPGIITMTVCSGSATTSISLFINMIVSIIARFRTTATTHASPLTGNAIGTILHT